MRRETPIKEDARSIAADTPIWIAWLAFAAMTLAVTRPDPDLWGHVRFGLDWWHTHRLPSVDPYSFTQDRPWINHEWLSEALMGGAFDIAGSGGLIALKMAILGTALLVLRRRLRGCTLLVTLAVLSLAIVCALPAALTVRPQLWSVLGLVVVFALVDTDGPPTATRIVGVTALFALWANLHGGWITGAAVLSVYTAVRALRERRDLFKWGATLAAALAGTLMNPYGVGLWRFLATTVRAARPDVSEWAPLTIHSPWILWLPLAAISLLTLALSRSAQERPRLEVWAVLVVLIAGAVRVLRVAPLMGPVALVLLGPCICRAWGGKGRVHIAAGSAARVFWIPAIVALAAAARPTASAFTCLPIEATWAPDLAAAAHLRGAAGRMVTTFDWGEYAIWHFGPRLLVSVDGRRETVYSDAVVQWHRAFERGESAAQSTVAQLAPDYVWLPASRGAAKLWLAAHGYRIDVDTRMSFVAVRHDRLKPPDNVEPLRRCFP